MAFGIRFSDGFARDTTAGEIIRGAMTFRREDDSLADHAITDGRTQTERVDEILTFGGSGITGGEDVEPLLTLGPSVVSVPDRTPEAPRIPIGGWYQAAVLEYGEGRTAFFGEAGMFFAMLKSFNLCSEVSEQNPFACFAHVGYKETPEQNSQLLLNVFHWFSHAIEER